MAQSLVSSIFHIVFGTKNRVAYLDDEISPELYLYIAKILQNHNCHSLRIGGMADHIHIFCALAKNITLSKIIEEVKTSPSKWVKTKDPKYKDFYWQAGYGAFSVSLSLKDQVCSYINNQKQHHHEQYHHRKSLL